MNKDYTLPIIIAIHNRKEFDFLISKADNKLFNLKLEEMKNERFTNK